ncbi:MAG TPA: sulfur carrier protein ThiS [Bacillota bacterium]|nr:sulfur carrier protein ThiS [Bacillota bacterium]HOL10069.1 sulfur carrier protein ThiS [Bacillota bacterium]HPO98339.1 sulfur carrier protein ThiS [Bacillota bacterium]
MKLKVNGREIELEKAVTLSEFLKSRGFEPERIVVERNLEIVTTEAWGQIILEDGDQLEILSFVGGG